MIVLTNHVNLQTFTTTKELTSERLARWSETLLYYNIVIRHVARTTNSQADALSRKPGYKDVQEYRKATILTENKLGDLVLS